MSQKQKQLSSRKSTKRVRATPLDGSEEISPPELDAPVLPAGSHAEDAPLKLGRKAYEAELAKLQAELVAMQEWVKATGAKVCIVFEGRDTAGKGGTIKRITERVSPRVFRVVALSAPTEREKSQMHIQRYLATSRPRARSSSSIAAGTTAAGSSG